MRARGVLAATVVSLLGTACSSQSMPLPFGAADATIAVTDGSVPDTTATPEVAVVVPSPDALEAGPPAPPSLRPASPAPPSMGDGKLSDVPDQTPGGSPDGWDFCQVGPLVVAPRDGKSDPPASRGDQYFLYSSAGARPPGDPAEPLAQAYFYFGERLAVGGNGLWFDATLVSGGAAGTTFDLYSVDKICQKSVTLGRFSLDPVLATPGKWTTTCIDLPSGLVVEGLGIRLAASNAEIGIDAFRFAPPCPAIR